MGINTAGDQQRRGSTCPPLRTENFILDFEQANDGNMCDMHGLQVKSRFQHMLFNSPETLS